MRVGQNIRALRKKQGLTQAQLGRLCGVTGPMLSGYERGETLPKKKVLDSIAEALGVPVSRLMEASGSEGACGTWNGSRRLLMEGILGVLEREYGQVKRKTVGDCDDSGSYYLIGTPPESFVLYEEDLRAMTEAAKASIAALAEGLHRRQALEQRKLG